MSFKVIRPWTEISRTFGVGEKNRSWTSQSAKRVLNRTDTFSPNGMLLTELSNCFDVNVKSLREGETFSVV